MAKKRTPSSARSQEIRSALAGEARRRGYDPRLVKMLEDENGNNDAAVALLSSLASLGKLWRRNPDLKVSELFSLWQEKAKDPARITRILLLLGEAWRQHPDVSLTQLLRKAYALGVDAEQAHEAMPTSSGYGLNHAGDDVIEAGLRKMCGAEDEDEPLPSLVPALQHAARTLRSAWRDRDNLPR